MYYLQKESEDEKGLERIHHGVGEIQRRKLFHTSSNLPVQIEIWTLGKGVSEGSHTHGEARPLEEMYYFLDGIGEMTIEGKRVTVKKNDAVMVPPGVEHDIKNSGAKPLKIMLVWGISSDRHYSEIH